MFKEGSPSAVAGFQWGPPVYIQNTAINIKNHNFNLIITITISN